jgi:hypothetical protein
MSSNSRYAKTTHWMKGAFIAFFHGPKKPVIEGGIEVGRGEMRVWVVLDDAMLAQIARIAAYLSAEPDPEKRGHAFWHSENPEREYPCDQCSNEVRAAKERWAKRIDAHVATLAAPTSTSSDRQPGGKVRDG